MFVLHIPIFLSTTTSAVGVARYWCWSTAVYAASLPISVYRFLIHLWIPPSFQVTPKGNVRSGPRKSQMAVLVPLGIVTLWLSKFWYSPFSLILASYGVAFLCFPAYFYLAEQSVWGQIARSMAWIPSLLFIGGLYAMWTLGRF